MTYDKTSNSDSGDECNNVTSILHNQEARCRHMVCVDKADCITTNNMPANMTTETSSGPVKGETRIRSGQ